MGTPLKNKINNNDNNKLLS